MTDLTDYDLTRIDGAIQHEERHGGRNVALADRDSEAMYAEARRANPESHEVWLFYGALWASCTNGTNFTIVDTRAARAVHDLIVTSRAARKQPVAVDPKQVVL